MSEWSEAEAPEPVAPEASPPAAGATDDDSLILWMLGLDATGRLAAAQGFADSVALLRHARRLD